MLWRRSISSSRCGVVRVLTLGVALGLALLPGCTGRKAPTKVASEAADGATAIPGGSVGVVQSVFESVGEGKGVSLRRGSGAWEDAQAGSAIDEGTAVRTDALSRVWLSLKDGTDVALDRQSEVRFGGSPRQVKVLKGAVYLDVTPTEASMEPVELLAPGGAKVVVKGTKLLMEVSPKETRVAVSRGSVELVSGGERISVRAGHEAVAEGGAAPRLETARNLAYVTEWARSLKPVEIEATKEPQGIGTLTARRPVWSDNLGRMVYRNERPLALKRHQVRVTIQGNIARTEIEEEFYNPTGSVLEGKYVFPLPPGATISRLALYVGNRIEEGEIVEKVRARRIFKQIVESSIRPRDPALLEWTGGSTFSMKIYPIPARGSRRVILGYTEVLPARYGRQRYVYPLARGAGQTGEVGEFSVAVALRGTGQLKEVSTPRYPSEVTRTTDGAEVRFAAKAFRPAVDFALEWRPAQEGPEAQVATYQARDGSRYFAAALRPQLRGEIQTGARDYVFVIDTSHGIDPALYQGATTTVAAFATEMDTTDRFTVLACDVVCRRLPGGFLVPDRAAVKQTVTWLKSLTLGGSTNLDGMFYAASVAAQEGRRPRIVYLGDGSATSGELRPPELLARIDHHLKQVPGVRVDVVALGQDVDELIVNELARRHGGTVRALGGGGDVVKAALEIVAAQYTTSLSRASVMIVPRGQSGLERGATGLRPGAKSARTARPREGIPAGQPLEIVGSAPIFPPPRTGDINLYPERLPTLEPGDEVLVVGRFSGEQEVDLVLQGEVDGRPVERRYPLHLTAQAGKGNAFIPALWAKRRIDHLTLEDADRHRKEIIRVSKAHTVMSRYTAFLVLENEKMYKEFRVKRVRHREDRGAEKKQVEWSAVQGAKTAGAGQLAGGLTKEAQGAADPAPTTTTEVLDQASRRETRAARLQAEEEPAEPDADDLGEAASATRATASGRRGAAGKGMERPMMKRSRAKMSARGPAAPMARPRPRAARPSFEPSPRAKPRMDALADLFEDGPGPSLARRPYRHPPPCRPFREARISEIPQTPATASPKEIEQIGSLRAAVVEHPLVRKHRRALVRALLKHGRVDAALEAARQWATTDADHPDALEQLGDLQARSGELAEALRTYDAMAEVSRWSSRIHQRLAEMHEAKGHRPAACAHWRSAVSLKPTDATMSLALARCELRWGERGEARRLAEAVIRAKGARSARTEASRILGLVDLKTLPAPPARKPPHGDIVVEVRWDGEVDLDVALRTPRGHRLSALAPSTRGRVVFDARQGSAGPETLAMRRARNGRYVVEVGAAKGALTAPVRGTAMIKVAGTTRKTISFQVPPTGGAVEVARLKYTFQRRRCQRR